MAKTTLNLLAETGWGWEIAKRLRLDLREERFLDTGFSSRNSLDRRQAFLEDYVYPSHNY
jgi:hypothetical protein